MCIFKNSDCIFKKYLKKQNKTILPAILLKCGWIFNNECYTKININFTDFWSCHWKFYKDLSFWHKTITFKKPYHLIHFRIFGCLFVCFGATRGRAGRSELRRFLWQCSGDNAVLGVWGAEPTCEGCTQSSESPPLTLNSLAEDMSCLFISL